MRMGPATDLIPKPMLPVGGKPILEHQLLWLKSWDFKEVILCLGYKAEAVTDYFGDGSKWNLSLKYSVEKTPRGTAGCVRDMAGELKGDALIVYGDLFIDMDCGKLLDFHGGHKGDATIVVFESDHPMDSDLARIKNGRITGFFRPRPGESFDNNACAAVWVLRKPLIELIPADKPSDFGRDIFPLAVAKGRTLMAYKSDETLLDLGTPERLEAFSRSGRPS